MRPLLACARRRFTVLAVAVLGVLVLGGLLNALPASAATKHRHRHHSRRHAADAAPCANADAPVSQTSTSQLRPAVVCLINKARQAHGLPSLSASSRLNHSAQNWTDTMVATGQFDHGDPGARVSAVGFNWSTVGENIATGFTTPRRVVAAWMASQGHCMNILDPVYTQVGTGVNRSPVSGFASIPGTWTQDVGLWMGARSPSDNWGPADHCPY
jgi:uncharacterized protein YkwD